MQAQIAFEGGAFKLPMPCREAARDGEGKTQRGSDQVKLSHSGKDRLLSPEREDFEDNARDKKRNRKMDDHRMLRVRCKQCSPEIERIGDGEDIHFSTTIVPVILG